MMVMTWAQQKGVEGAQMRTEPKDEVLWVSPEFPERVCMILPSHSEVFKFTCHTVSFSRLISIYVYREGGVR